MRLTKHEDGWIYGVFCSECADPKAAPGDLSSALARTGIVRTKDLKNWERLPNLIAKYQQRNVVLHPEFIDGKLLLCQADILWHPKAKSALAMCLMCCLLMVGLKSQMVMFASIMGRLTHVCMLLPQQ
jgi:predicted GH43/DUF377 family glycosyl hydrolase